MVAECEKGVHHGNHTTDNAVHVQPQRLSGSMIDVSRNATRKTALYADDDNFERQHFTEVDGGQDDLDDCLEPSSRVPLAAPYQRRLPERPREGYLTAYERLSYELATDRRCLREITLGKRVGFYQLRNQIGSGNFSSVKLGVHILTREKVAVKILDKTRLDAKTRRLLSREITSMEKLHHPNIVRLYEMVETLSKLYIILEYAPEGELYTKITSNPDGLPEPEAKVTFAQIVSAVQHMHEKQVVHRDLKAENIYFTTRQQVKVGDFGFSTTCDDGQTLSTFCGSPPYAAPELFRDDSYYGPNVDVWALGILLYFMVVGVLPFRADTVGKLKRCILEGAYTTPEHVSDDCRLLIRGILRPAPSDRYSIREIRDSDWLNDVEFPQPLEPYMLGVDDGNRALTVAEAETRRQLEELGMSEQHIEAARTRQSRSSVSGTYHILLHSIQNRLAAEAESAVAAAVQDTDVPETTAAAEPVTASSAAQTVTKRSSKVCTVL